MAMEPTEFAFPMDAEECEEGYDREYTADDFARYFRAFLTSGIIADGGNIAESLQVVANDDMTTTLKAGNLIIDGYRYELMKDMVFQHRAADGVLDRIDRISITLDTAEREIHAMLREGEYSYKPVAPQCRRSSEYMDYVVADVRIVKGAIKVTQANITDTRLSTELCGIAFPFWKLDTTPFFAQLNSFYNEFVLKSDRSYDEFLAWAEEKKAEITTWQGKEEAEIDAWQEEKKEGFDEWVQDFVNKWESWLLGETKSWQEEIIDWFDNLKEHLEENAAVQLQLQIGNLENLKTDAKDDLVSAINSLCLSYDETMAILAGIATVTVTLSANDGASVEGQNVTLHNMMTEKDTVMEYSGEELSFEVFSDMEYSLTVEDMEDYVTPDPVKITISEGDRLEIDLKYKFKPLNDLSWAKIIEISEGGKASEVFNIHDTKEIELTTGEKVVVEIVGFDHDILADNTEETAGITFGTRDCNATRYQMNSTNTNVGGWKESEMRSTHIRDNFFEVLPEDLKNGIKTVNKKTSTGNMSTTVETTEDDVWLFSVAELGITGLSMPYSQEGTAYPAFTSNASRVRNGGAANGYFTRSSNVGDAIYFRVIDRTGGNTIASPSAKEGMVAGFCV